MLMHVLGASMASLNEIEETASIIPGATHFLIKNHINATEFFKWDAATHEKIFGASRSGIIEIPQLTEMAIEALEVSSTTFTQFVSNQKNDGTPAAHSFVLRGYVRTWLKAVFEAFDRANVNGLVGAAITS
jgi:hypothetical protein